MNRTTTMALLALAVALAVTIGSVQAVQFLPLIVNRRSANHLDHHKLVKEINELDWYGSTRPPSSHQRHQPQPQQEIVVGRPLVWPPGRDDTDLAGGVVAAPTLKPAPTMKAPASEERDFNTRILRDFRLDLQNLNEPCPRDIEIAAAASGYRFRCVDGKIPRASFESAPPPTLLAPLRFSEPALASRQANNDPSRRIRSTLRCW